MKTMGQVQRVTIDSIFGGVSSTQYAQSSGQYLNAVGIDPDFPISDSSGDFRASGALRPTSYAEFSGTNVNANPYWLTTTPKDTSLYAYLKNGKFFSYNSSLGGESLVATASSSSGNGMAYYNNYIYTFRNTDVDRYGPLDGTPAYGTSVWTGATLGSQTALTNTVYQTHRGAAGNVPNHAAHVHTDNALYFCDFKDGQGLIHKIKTTKTTDEGDTNDGSAYNALDLPFGYMPTDIESYGTDLVICAVQTSDTALNQGKAALFFWDTVASSFYRQVELPHAMATALKMNNGILYIWTGNLQDGGYQLSVYAGGQTVQSLFIQPDGVPPLAGAVDSTSDRIYWGTVQRVQTTTPGSPDYAATVMAYGSHDPRLPKGVHSVAVSDASASSSDGLVTCILLAEQSQIDKSKLVIGWRDGSNIGLDKISTTYGNCTWHSPMVNVGSNFTIRRVRMALPVAVAANMTITPKFFLDDSSDSSDQGMQVISNSNPSSGKRFIEYRPDINGNHNFYLELKWSGTALLPVLLPITIDVEVNEQPETY